MDSLKSTLLMREEENAFLRRQFQDERDKLEEEIELLKRQAQSQERKRDSYAD